MTKLLYTGADKKTLVEFTRYRHATYDYDFGRSEGGGEVNSRYTVWNGQSRHSNAMTYFEAFESKLNGQDFDTLLNLPKIFVTIMADDSKTDPEISQTTKQKNKPESRSKKLSEFMMKELKKYGKEEIIKHIKSELAILNNKERSKEEAKKHTTLQFFFNKIDLTMITLNSQPFLHAHIDELRTKIDMIGGISTSYSISLQTLTVKRCSEASINYKFNLSRKAEIERIEQPGYDVLNPEGDHIKIAKDDYVLRVMYDSSNNGQTLTSKIHDVETIQLKREGKSPQKMEERQMKENLMQLKNQWRKGAFSLEQTIYKIPVKDQSEAKEEGIEPYWTAVSRLDISTKPFEVRVDMQIIKLVREYLLVREWNKIYKAVQNKDLSNQLEVILILIQLFITNNGRFFKEKEESIQTVKKELANEQSEENRKKAQEQAMIVPTYYRQISMQKTNLVITFLTDNKLLVESDN